MPVKVTFMEPILCTGHWTQAFLGMIQLHLYTNLPGRCWHQGHAVMGLECLAEGQGACWQVMESWNM